MKKCRILIISAVALLLGDSTQAQDFVQSGAYTSTVYRYSSGQLTGIAYITYLKKDKGGFGSLTVSATKSGVYTDTVSTGEILKITLVYNTSFWGYNVAYNDYTEIQLNLLSSNRTQNIFYQLSPMIVVNPSRAPYWRKFILDTCTSISIAREQPTAVEDPERRTLPTSFSLFQNYPNPFNPSTTITYSLPKTVLVSLRIFNSLGQELALLVNEQKASGYHQATWNSTVASGIYFCRLQAGDFVDTKKLILLK